VTGATLAEDGGIVTVTFDRPDKLNAIDPGMTEVLWQATRALRDRDDLRVLVIRAEGTYFTAGIDLGAVPGELDGGRPESDIRYRRLYRDHHLLYDEIEAVEKPVVLAAQGPCLGAGVELAVSCDFRFAARSARFHLPEINLGVIPGSGGTGRLTRLVGPHWAKWMAMAGQSLTAERAVTAGLVHDVFPDDELDASVTAFARGLIEIPVEALGVAKLTVDLCADLDRTGQRHLERIVNTRLTTLDEFVARSARFRRR
jgi:enoyl-CoA hydratase/carnithine racemase